MPKNLHSPFPTDSSKENFFSDTARKTSRLCITFRNFYPPETPSGIFNTPTGKEIEEAIRIQNFKTFPVLPASHAYPASSSQQREERWRHDRGTIHACHSACDANPAEAHTVASWVAGEDTWPCITLIRFSVTLAEVSTKDVPFAEDCLLPRLRFAWRIQSYPLCVGKCTPLRRELYLHVSTPNAIARRDLQQMRALTATSNPVKP